MHIAGDVQIEQSVAVVVAPGRAGRPVAERHAGLFGHVGEGAVVIVVVEPVLAVVAHVDVGPAVVVVVGNRAAISPAVVGHAGLLRDIGERAVVIVVEQRGVRRLFLAVERVEGRAVDEVDIEPAVVVVVDQANAGAVGLDDEVLLRGAHLVDPAGEPGLFGDVLKDHRAGVDEAARGDGPFLLVVDRGSADAAGDAHSILAGLCGRWGRLLRPAIARE